MNSYPIYIVSKGRYNRRPTANAIEEMGVSYFIIVEEHEKELYAEKVKGEVLVLPKKYKDDYDCFWDDNDKRTGPGPARNFAWDHASSKGYKWHWVMDDNIEAFEVFNNNLKVKSITPLIFKVMEDFANRYSNVAQCGPNYSFFCPANEGRPPIKINTRIYSCLLIRNDIPFRWRGRYNEDTDLSIRCMKAGWCTIQFNAFLQAKRATQTMSGGNSKEFYDVDGTFYKSKMLEDMHPDVAVVSKRFNRWHHYVDYGKFKHVLLKRVANYDEIVGNKRVKNYGMKLITKEDYDNSTTQSLAEIQGIHN